MKLFGTMKKNQNGNLEIGMCDAIDLAKEYGTPLYVIDEELVRRNCRTFKENFKADGIETEVIYASKAFLNLAICKVIEEEGLSLDVVSGGELYTAIRSDFPLNRVYMHGNNKTEEELRLAIESNIGRIVVDNRYELELIRELCDELDKNIDVLLRVNPGVDAHTHEYIQTSKNDSKFGESIFSEDIYEVIKSFMKSERVTLRGFHCHIGSQIFQETSFYMSVSVMIDFISRIKEKCDFVTRELNMGGGFGVYYCEGDSPIELGNFLSNMVVSTKEECSKHNLAIPKIMIEPGRSIIANAGTTLYKIGGTKKTYGEKNYIFVDGGMTDNIRTALYDAKYEAIVANKLESNTNIEYTIAGKCCESGDIIIKDIVLPEVKRNDILAVLSTGAYNYTMASNYNRIPKPSVVFVKDGIARLAVKRETYEDILRNDVMF